MIDFRRLGTSWEESAGYKTQDRHDQEEKEIEEEK